MPLEFMNSRTPLDFTDPMIYAREVPPTILGETEEVPGVWYVTVCPDFTTSEE